MPCKTLGVLFILILLIKYIASLFFIGVLLYFDFFALVPRQKPSVEFRHLTRNASKYSAENKGRSVLTLGLPSAYLVRDTP